jgi:hypothetical protein
MSAFALRVPVCVFRIYPCHPARSRRIPAIEVCMRLLRVRPRASVFCVPCAHPAFSILFQQCNSRPCSVTRHVVLTSVIPGLDPRIHVTTRSCGYSCRYCASMTRVIPELPPSAGFRDSAFASAQNDAWGLNRLSFSGLIRESTLLHVHMDARV